MSIKPTFFQFHLAVKSPTAFANKEAGGMRRKKFGKSVFELREIDVLAGLSRLIGLARAEKYEAREAAPKEPNAPKLENTCL